MCQPQHNYKVNKPIGNGEVYIQYRGWVKCIDIFAQYDHVDSENFGKVLSTVIRNVNERSHFILKSNMMIAAKKASSFESDSTKETHIQ